jgi:hypothetical protein
MDPKENNDNPKTAPESGDPLSSGRSHGKVVNDSTQDETERAEETGTVEHPESGRHGATPPSTRPNVGTQGV